MQIDWQRCWDLEKKDWNDLTDEEKEFYKYMYHVEEFQAGLDGDR